MIRRPPRSTQSRSSAASDVYKRQLITPILVRAFDEILKTIPVELQEASFSLGSTQTETAMRVLLKQGFAGFITALLLAFGRGIGDAASVLFTAGYTDNI